MLRTSDCSGWIDKSNDFGRWIAISTASLKGKFALVLNTSQRGLL
jgi:hypothetical protein